LPSRQLSRGSSLVAQFLFHRFVCSSVSDAKLPPSAMTLHPRGGGAAAASRQRSRGSSLGAQFLFYKSFCSSVVGAKLPLSAMTLTRRGWWGSCCPHSSEAGAPRSGHNFCFINLLVPASGEASYPRRQRCFPREGMGQLLRSWGSSSGLIKELDGIVILALVLDAPEYRTL
jgi:hypothetical protein